MCHRAGSISGFFFPFKHGLFLPPPACTLEKAGHQMTWLSVPSSVSLLPGFCSTIDWITWDLPFPQSHTLCSLLTPQPVPVCPAKCLVFHSPLLPVLVFHLSSWSTKLVAESLLLRSECHLSFVLKMLLAPGLSLVFSQLFSFLLKAAGFTAAPTPWQTHTHTSVTWSECMVLISQTQPSSECPEIWTETT